MLGRNGNIAYVRYDSQGRIVPGGPIISPYRPKVGLWQPVSQAIGNSVLTSNSLRAFVRLDAYGRVVPSSLLLLSQAPSDADSGTYWLEINATYRPSISPTTTTTTTHGGVTPTAWFGQIAFTGPSSGWAWRACNGFGFSTIVYTSSTTITAGTYLYKDAALTVPLDSPSAISFPITGLVFDVVNGQTNPLGGDGTPCGSVTTTSTTTADPYTYYLTNMYNCTNCNAIVGQNVIIKTLNTTGIYNGCWLNDTNTPNLRYNVLGVTQPFYMALAINNTLVNSQCASCATTTTTTTTVAPGPYTVFMKFDIL